MKKKGLVIKRPIIIPEIYGKTPICDYLPQTANCLIKLNYPVIVYLINYPAKPPSIPKFDRSKINYYYPQHILPFNRLRIIRQIQIYLSFNFLYLYCILRYKIIPIYWVFYPQIYRLIKLSFKPQTLIYDIIDYFSGCDKGKKYFLSNAHVVTAISQSMVSSYLKIFPIANIKIVPQGFRLIKSISVVHPKIKKIKLLKNKIGYIGAINNRFDFDLLFKLISATPSLNYIFIGPIDIDGNISKKLNKNLITKLFSFKNVYHIDLVPKTQIGQFINIFDIAIIPYNIKDDFNRLCYPMKLFEYFAFGKPVISTPIEELKQFPEFVFIGNSADEWINNINQILSSPWTKKKQIQEKILAQKNSWENKVNKIIGLLAK